MDSRFNSPAEIASLVSKSGVTKSMLSLPKMILLGLMAGAFIAFGGLGAFTIKVALAKTTINPATAIISGILCNILVCLAIVMATGATDAIGKIFGVFFPICAFVVCGFEHCVANMFYIPTGVMAAMNPEYVAKAQELYGITAQQCQNLANLSGCESLLFVTIGNIIGGMVFVGFPLYFAYIRKKKNA